MRIMLLFLQLSIPVRLRSAVCGISAILLYCLAHVFIYDKLNNLVQWHYLWISDLIQIYGQTQLHNAANNYLQFDHFFHTHSYVVSFRQCLSS